MNRPFVSLRPEITRTHALLLRDWLEDERVTCHLSDSRNISGFIERAVDRTNLPILTHLFNQSGRFFMVCDRDDRPVGFVRLVNTASDCEIVLVIGDHDNWGRRLGASAIREALKIAFLEMRTRRVIARIHPDNARSLKVFQRCGFLFHAETATLRSLAMTAGRYLRLLREGAMTDTADIYITETDKTRLDDLIAFEQGQATAELEHELERAVVVDPLNVSPEVVTMNSRVMLHLDEDEVEVALVYPQDADERFGKLSVLSDVGAAILGYQEGIAIDWMVSERTRRIVIDRVMYQPEAAGDFHL